MSIKILWQIYEKSVVLLYFEECFFSVEIVEQSPAKCDVADPVGKWIVGSVFQQREYAPKNIVVDEVEIYEFL